MFNLNRYLYFEMVHFFAEQNPDKLAVVTEYEKITYKELDDKINQICIFLKSYSVGPGDIVPIISPNSIDAVCAILGVVKSGAAYLPIDENLPDKRIAYMLSQINFKVILHDTKKNLPYNYEKIKIRSIYAQDITVTSYDIHKDDETVYIIFTSGSSGMPKGVKISFSSFANLLDWFLNTYSFTSRDNILLYLSLSFDAAQKNIFLSLLVGATLYLFSNSPINYPNIIKSIEKNKISIINSTPSGFIPILLLAKKNNYAQLASLKLLFLGGETFEYKSFANWCNTEKFKCRLINVYGPTECTDIVSYYEINHAIKYDKVPIGCPIQNVTFLVMNQNKEEILTGQTGELYISGLCLSKGYLNSNDNAEKYVNIQGITYYKTGDLVKKLSDDNLLFIGREDNQIKILGHRIELEEIESQINQCDGIHQCIVVNNNSNDNQQLECFYTGDYFINQNEIKHRLSTKLPLYMVPFVFKRVRCFLHTSSGKIDRSRVFECEELYSTDDELDVSVNEQNKGGNESYNEIFSTIISTLKIDPSQKITMNTPFDDLGIDSVAFVKTIISLEDKFAIEFESEKFIPSAFPTIESMINYVASKLGKE